MQRALPTYQSSHRSDDSKNAWRQNDIGAIFKDYGEAYIKQYKPYIDKIKLIRAIRICKTPRLGGRMIECKQCSNKHYIYLSCGHSHCPICQSIKREQWVDKLHAALLTVPYVHVVFTLPRELRRVALNNERAIYKLIMRSSWQTIKQICSKQSNVGGLPGMISVLHTFGSDMKYHVHTHNLVTFGGLDVETGKWKSPKRKDKLAKYRQINEEYKKIFLAGLIELYEKGEITYHQDYEEVAALVKDKNWVVHNTPPTIDTRILENYLARYINRVAVSKSRVTYLRAQQKVQLLYKDYESQKEDEAAPKVSKELDPLSFIHQFLVHKLPPYFQKSRRYGLHSPPTSKKYAKPLSKLKQSGAVIRTVMQIVTSMMGIEAYKCEHCGSEHFEIHEVPSDYSWGYQIANSKHKKQRQRGPPR